MQIGQRTEITIKHLNQTLKASKRNINKECFNAAEQNLSVKIYSKNSKLT